MQREVCSHAALATLVDESLRLKYGIALYKSDEIHHDLILSTLSAGSCPRDDLSDFLTEVEFEGIESAVVKTLEHEPALVFPRPDKIAANAGEHCGVLSKFLLEVAWKSKITRNRFLAAKWLPYYTNTANASALLEQLLHHYDANIRALSALHLSHIDPNYPQIATLLWKPVEHSSWSGREYVQIAGRQGLLQRVVLERLVQIACLDDPKTHQKDFDSWARFWFQQMNLTSRADRRAFQVAINRFYSSIHLSAPQVVHWFDSPAAAAVAAAEHFETLQRKSAGAKPSSISKPHAYLSRLIDTIESFPGDANWRKNWIFGSLNYNPDVEFIRDEFLVCCGTPLLYMKPRRRRHLWDAVSEYKHPQIDDDALSFMSLLLDYTRLGMVGYRSVLRLKGACPHTFDGLEQLLQICPTFVAFDDAVFAAERPVAIRRDERGRLHSLDAPSIEYADGWGVYSVHGISVRPEIIKAPLDITPEEIIRQENVEVRRVMLERYGAEKFVATSGAEVISEDECGTLYRMPVKYDHFNMVRVVNKTPEPDGTYRVYFLTVPPETLTAREAVAWSFQMQENQYNPGVET